MNRFPISGRHLALLAALASPRKRQDLLRLESSEQWLDRHLGRMVEQGLIDREQAGRETIYRTRVPEFSRASSRLLSARPDTRLGWYTSAEISVLATLPLHGIAPAGHEVAGISRTLWHTTVSRLRETGFVIGRGRTARANPDLIELHDVVREYRRLHTRPPIGGSAPRCIHQKGIEAAWAADTAMGVIDAADLRPFGPSGPHRFFTPILSRATFLYGGPRELILADEILLYIRASVTPPPDPLAQEMSGTLERRAEGLLGYALGSDGLAREIRERSAHYGLETVVQTLTHEITTGSDRIQASLQEIRRLMPKGAVR